MKIIFSLLLIFVLFLNDSDAQSTYTINVVGFTFSPNEVTVEIGDTVFFNGSSDHPVLEVSEGTWNVNGDNALSGGFGFPSGRGKISFDEAGEHFYICENHISSGMKGKIIVNSTTTSVNSLELKDLRIYPNPLTSNILNIELPSKSNDISLNIFDLTGRIKIHKEISMPEDIIKIDGSYLNPGAYIIQLNTNGSVYTSKFIKN